MRGRYHIEPSPLICSANQWTRFYMITAPVMKESIIREAYQCEEKCFIRNAEAGRGY